MIDLLDFHKINEENKIKCLDHGFVRLVDIMPRISINDNTPTGDFSIVQAARVSYGDGTKSVNEDEGLIRYLMRHQHTTPFEMAEVKFHIKLPIFVARQWIRHRTACLSGSTLLNFDTSTTNKTKHYPISISDFYTKWNSKNYVESNYKHKDTYCDNVITDKEYTIKELAICVNRCDSTIREIVQNGKLKICDVKPYKILGSAWIEYCETKWKKLYPKTLQTRCNNMDIRHLDESTGVVDHTQIIDIWETGIKKVYEYTFENNNSIRCTKDHLVLTNHGWKKICELEEDKKLLITYIRPKGVTPLNIKIEYSKTDLMNEKWSKYPKNNSYVISTLGRVKSLKTNRILNTNMDNYRPAFNISDPSLPNGQQKIFTYTAVLETFVSNKPANMECCHRDGNYYNNRLENLYWGSPQNNSDDRIRHNMTSKLRKSFTRLKTVVYIGEEMTYDLEVASDDHNFSANGFIVHNSVNEYSGRYSIMSPDFYIPEIDRIQNQSKTNNQGTDFDGNLSLSTQMIIQKKMKDEQEELHKNYEYYLEADIARELARNNLPVSNYTEWYWKIDLKNLFHFLSLRLDSHAQYEIRVFAEAIYKFIKPIFPFACKAFEDYQLNGDKISNLEKEIISAGLGIINQDNNFIDNCLDNNKLLSKREKLEFKNKFGL